MRLTTINTPVQLYLVSLLPLSSFSVSFAGRVGSAKTRGVENFESHQVVPGVYQKYTNAVKAPVLKIKE